MGILNVLFFVGIFFAFYLYFKHLSDYRDFKDKSTDI